MIDDHLQENSRTLKVLCICSKQYDHLREQLSDLGGPRQMKITYWLVDRQRDLDADYGDFDVALLLLDPPMSISLPWLFDGALPVLALVVEQDRLELWPANITRFKSAPLSDLSPTKCRAALEEALNRACKLLEKPRKVSQKQRQTLEKHRQVVAHAKAVLSERGQLRRKRRTGDVDDAREIINGKMLNLDVLSNEIVLRLKVDQDKTHARVARGKKGALRQKRKIGDVDARGTGRKTRGVDFRSKTKGLSVEVDDIDGSYEVSVPAPTTPSPTAQVPTKPFLNTGFAPVENPQKELRRKQYLETGSAYYFWVQIGALLEGAMHDPPAVLPVEHLPAEAELFLELVPEDNLVTLTGKDGGVLCLTGRGTALVRNPLAELADLPAQLRRQRLYIPLQTGAVRGVARLQLNVFYNNLKIQSHLIEAQVGKALDVPGAIDIPVGLRASLVYSTYGLDKVPLGELEPTSFGVSQSEHNGTHFFSFWGGKDSGLRHSMTVTDGELSNLISMVRHALHYVAWGNREPWNKEPYRYQSPSSGQMWRDLARLARVGAQVFDKLSRGFAGVKKTGAATEKIDTFLKQVRQPGLVQIAAYNNVRQVIPVAILYDLNIDAGANDADIKPCRYFQSELSSGASPQETSCFLTGCKSDPDLTVCPSGFWGFRHRIGIPPGAQDDCVVEIQGSGGVKLAMALSTDPKLTMREPHQAWLMQAGANWQVAENLKDTKSLLGKPYQLLYFYCHGGYGEDNQPYLQVGVPDSRGLLPYHINRTPWLQTRPLIILNGCHTTALEPESAFDFVNSFTNANCSGVIGTEITLFEPLACRFMELFLPLFLDGIPIGEALRQVRLTLLAENNPLGLIYIAYALANLKLVN